MQSEERSEIMHIMHIDAFRYVDCFKATDIYKNKECHKNIFAVLIYSVVSCVGSHKTLSLSIPPCQSLTQRDNTVLSSSSPWNKHPCQFDKTHSLLLRGLSLARLVKNIKWISHLFCESRPFLASWYRVVCSVGIASSFQFVYSQQWGQKSSTLPWYFIF